jgi:hypothetical protein
MRLELAQLAAGEDRVVDPILVEVARLGDLLAQARLGAQAPDPTVLTTSACAVPPTSAISALCSSTHRVISGANARAERSMRSGAAFCH